MMNWHVIYTSPRSEKRVAERLQKQQFEVYCPLIESIRQWSDRKKKVKVPLFTSYVFVRVKEPDRSDILRDPGVLNFVFWLGKPAIIRDQEMTVMMNFINNNISGDLVCENLESGDKVSLIDGPFKHQNGVFSHFKQGKPVLIIENLGLKIIAHPSQIKYSNA